MQANILGIESEITNEIFNLGTQTTFSIKQLFNMLKEIIRVDLDPEYRRAESIIQERLSNIEKARELLGYNPRISIREGLKEEVDYLTNLVS